MKVPKIFSIFGVMMLACPVMATTAMEKVHVGKFGSRAYWLPAETVDKSASRSPAIVLIPGSGANGPEEMIPGSLTEDGQDHGLFLQMAESFAAAGWNVLCLGKPGVEYFTEFNLTRWFYDQSLYRQLTWQSLVENLGEGIHFLRAQPTVDPKRVFVLGHSEGTRVAVDYAAKDRDLAGLILLGYSGEDIKTTLDWQLYQRPIEHLFATDIDVNRDKMTSRDELSRWPSEVIEGATEVTLDFGTKDELSFLEIEEQLRSSPALNLLYDKIKNSPPYADGQFAIGPIYEKTAALTIPVYIFTGALDLQTRPEEALAADQACRQMGKSNCYVNLVEGVGHGFSPPRGPRRHPLVDITVGPISTSFLDTLRQLAKGLSR